MKKNETQRRLYLKPCCEVIPLQLQALNLLTSLSLGGDFEDFEDVDPDAINGWGTEWHNL